MTRTEKMEQIKEQMCDNYCKYPNQYYLAHEDPEEGFEEMLRDICENCPLNDL